MAKKGFIKIPKRLFDTKWWNKKRVFSESDAFLDIYILADDRNTCKVSVRSLAGRWIWEQTKVFRFLLKLEKEGYLSVEKSISGMTLKIPDSVANTTQTATPIATPSATPKSANTEGLSDVGATPIATPSATQPATLSRAYKNDIIISCLNKDYKTNIIDSSLHSESISCSNQFSFDEFWNLYDKKVGKDKAVQLYERTSEEERKLMFEHIKKYKIAQPDKKYRKNPETYLRNKSWNDEIIQSEPIGFTLRDNDNRDKYKDDLVWK